MSSRLLIPIALTFLLLASCSQRKVDFVPDTLYRIVTTEGDGFVRFEHTPDDQWTGKYYLSKGRLMAEKRVIKLKVGDEIFLVDDTDREIPIISYSRYEQPIFKDYPDTRTYLDSVFAITVNENVVYGCAQGYWVSYPDSGGTTSEIFEAKKAALDEGKKEVELTMDVYLPNDNKDIPRPLLVLVHGGAFFNGDKADMGFPEWASHFAGLGYVVASVNYRLGFRKTLPSVKRAGYRGVQDVDAAIRYIIHHQDVYAVDPNRVFVAGTSAGGITALNVAFMRNENIPSSADEEGEIHAVNPEMNETYSIRAVGNLWGAVNDLSMLDNGSSSIISFHSTGDPVVPFGKGHPFENIFLNWLIFPTMYGSEKITTYLGNQRAKLISYEIPDRHTLHVDRDGNGNAVLNARFYEIETAMRYFFASVMQTSPIEATHAEGSSVFQILSPEVESVYWHVKGGAILNQSGLRSDVLLFPDAPSHSVTVSGKYKSGLTFRYKWNQ